MKPFWLITLAVLALGLTANAEQPPKHLFILSGQSNMAGLDPNLAIQGIHYTKEGCKELGQRFADKAIELVKKK